MELAILLGSLAILLLMLSAGAVASTGFGIAIIFFTSFSLGLFQVLGIPLAIPKIVAEFLAITLVVKALLLRVRLDQGRVVILGAMPIAGVFAAGLVSGLVHGAGLLSLTLFLRETVKFYLLFFALLNLRMSRRTVKRLCVLLVTLFLIQIPVSWVKLAMIGIQERWIGTVHWTAGELSVMLPLFAISFLGAAYLYTRRSVFLIPIIFFILFGISGEKRAVVILFPTLILFLAICFQIRERSKTRLRMLNIPVAAFSVRTTIAVVLMVTAGIVYFGVRLIPSLNPEEEVWGSFDVGFTVDYVTRYTSRNLRDPLNNPDPSEDSVNMGRLKLTGAAFALVMSDGSLTTLLGFGGNTTSPSPLGDGGPDPLFDRFGIRGPITGMVRVVLEAGLVGLGCMLYFLMHLYVITQRIYFAATDPGVKVFALGMLGTHLVFLIDFVIYSNATLLYGVLAPPYFFLMVVLLKGNVPSAAYLYRTLRLPRAKFLSTGRA